jgi:hypothetical protein
MTGQPDRASAQPSETEIAESDTAKPRFGIRHDESGLALVWMLDGLPRREPGSSGQVMPAGPMSDEADA